MGFTCTFSKFPGTMIVMCNFQHSIAVFNTQLWLQLSTAIQLFNGQLQFQLQFQHWHFQHPTLISIAVYNKIID